jgi:hypothetical protein
MFDQLIAAEEARRKVINVDDFDNDDLVRVKKGLISFALS